MSALLAFLAGAGSGYLTGEENKRKRSAEEEDRTWQREQRGRVKTQQAADDQLQSDMKAAAAPAEVAAGPLGDQSYGPPIAQTYGAGQSPSEYRMVAPGGVNQSFGTAAEASLAQKAYSAPEAVGQRQVMALDRAGQVDKANQLRESQMKLADQAHKMKENGMFEGLQAFRSGDKAGAIKALQGSGQYKIDGDVTMEPRELELPGFGKVNSYDLKFSPTGADGQKVPVVVNSHAASMAMLPYERALELQRKGGDSENKFTAALANLENKAKQLEMQGKVAEANITLKEAQAVRAQALAAGGGGRGGRGADERDRAEARITYSKELDGLGREIRDNQKALGDMMQWVGKDGASRKAALQQETNDLIARRNQVRSHLGDLTDASAEKRGGKAPTSPAAQSQPATPTKGEVRGGYRFKGGNPADKANWEKA